MAARLRFRLCLIVVLANIVCNEASRLKRIEDLLGGLQGQLGGIQNRMGAINKRVGRIQNRFSGVNTRLDELESNVDARFDELQERMDRESRYRREDTRKLFEKIESSMEMMFNMSTELARSPEQTGSSERSDNSRGEGECRLSRTDMTNLIKKIDGISAACSLSSKDVQRREQTETNKMDTVWKRDLKLLTKAFKDEKLMNNELRDGFPEFSGQMQSSMSNVLNEINTNQMQLNNIVQEMNELTTAFKDEQQLNSEIRDQFPDVVDRMKTVEEIVQGVNNDIQVVGTDMKIVLNGTDTNQIKLDNIVDEMTELKSVSLDFRETSLSKDDISYLMRCNSNYVRPRSCEELYSGGCTASGQYDVYPAGRTDPIRVYCDQDTGGGGWTVFQRRINGMVDFYRDWSNYSLGFGDLNGEFWIGNKYLSILTPTSDNRLIIELENFDGKTAYAKYDKFQIKPLSENYKLVVGGYSGTAGDSLAYHNGQSFSTKDRDNDMYSIGNCANIMSGAWWYQSCTNSNLNGRYVGRKSDITGISWETWEESNSLKFTEMKFK